MIYYTDERMTIRGLMQSDAMYFTEEEIKQGWHSTPEKLEMRLKDEREGRCIALAAEIDGAPAGYVSLYFEPHGAFGGKPYPMIEDLNVLEKYRRQGVAAKLMDTAEKLAEERSDTVCLGVGLHSGYGSAQRIYIKRGYVPDGSGVWYGGKPCTPYETYSIDDDLILYMSKKLR